MDEFTHVVFFADGSEGEAEALARTADIAAHVGARVTVLDVVPLFATLSSGPATSAQNLQTSLVDERQKVLEAAVAQLAPTVQMSVQVEVGENNATAVIQFVQQNNVSLLLKAADQHNLITEALFGSTDLQLIRKCPCPVWILKPGALPQIRQVLGAVDLTHDTDDSLAFAQEIIDTVQRIANMEDARGHLITAWQPPTRPQIINQDAQQEFQAYVDGYQAEITHRYQRIIRNDDSNIPGLDQLEASILRGKPSTMITHYVTTHDIDLLVMGSVTRTGIPGLIFGNTAERVLHHVDCSVLILKPGGFVSPVTVE